MKKKHIAVDRPLDASNKAHKALEREESVRRGHPSNAPSRGLAAEITGRFGLSPGGLAKYLGISLASVVSWERGDTTPGPRMQAKVVDALQRLERCEAPAAAEGRPTRASAAESVNHLLGERESPVPKVPYRHLRREDKIDYRMLYSEFLADGLIGRGDLVDFASFRTLAASVFERA
jgi:DNA-binding transcriptional regulator YiaG